MPRTKTSWLDRILVKDVSNRNCFEKYSIQIFKFLILAFREFGREKCYEKSAALTFVTLMCIFPLIALYLYMIPIIFGTEAVLQQKIANFIIGNLLPSASSDDEIGPAIQKIFRLFKENAGTFGILGALGLLVAGISLFITIEKSYNDVWHIEHHRNFFKSFTVFSGVMLWLPVLIGLSFYFSTVLAARSSSFFSTQLNLWLSFILGFIGLALSYYYIPNTKVNFRSALIAAIFSALLWEFAKSKFGILVRKPPLINNFFKTVGIIPIFIIWLYWVWLIILLGTEISYVYQNFDRLLSQVYRKISVNIDFLSLIAPLIVIGEYFNMGKGKISYEEVRSKVYLDPYILAKALDSLTASGVIIYNEGDDSYILQRPPERIYLQELVNLDKQFKDIFPDNDNRERKLSQFIKMLDTGILEKIQNKSLKELISEQ